jgi:hypothetical protein
MRYVTGIKNSTALANILNRASNSLKLELQDLWGCESIDKVVDAISRAPGYEAPRNNVAWKNRTKTWKKCEATGEIRWLCWDDKAVYLSYTLDESMDYIPIFNSFGDITQALVLSESINKITKQEKPNMKNLFDKVLDTNKDAAKMSAKITAGKTANDFIQSKIKSSMPWYARLFSRNSAAKESLGKLVVANMAVTLSTHFAEGDKRLAYISEAMLQDAMVELTRDSAILDKFIAELTEKVSVPNSVLEKFNQEQD